MSSTSGYSNGDAKGLVGDIPVSKSRLACNKRHKQKKKRTKRLGLFPLDKIKAIPNTAVSWSLLHNNKKQPLVAHTNGNVMATTTPVLGVNQKTNYYQQQQDKSNKAAPLPTSNKKVVTAAALGNDNRKCRHSTPTHETPIPGGGAMSSLDSAAANYNKSVMVMGVHEGMKISQKATNNNNKSPPRPLQPLGDATVSSVLAPRQVNSLQQAKTTVGPTTTTTTDDITKGTRPTFSRAHSTTAVDAVIHKTTNNVANNNVGGTENQQQPSPLVTGTKGQKGPNQKEHQAIVMEDRAKHQRQVHDKPLSTTPAATTATAIQKTYVSIGEVDVATSRESNSISTSVTESAQVRAVTIRESRTWTSAKVSAPVSKPTSAKGSAPLHAATVSESSKSTSARVSRPTRESESSKSRSARVSAPAIESAKPKAPRNKSVSVLKAAAMKEPKPGTDNLSALAVEAVTPKASNKLTRIAVSVPEGETTKEPTLGMSSNVSSPEAVKMKESILAGGSVSAQEATKAKASSKSTNVSFSSQEAMKVKAFSKSTNVGVSAQEKGLKSMFEARESIFHECDMFSLYNQKKKSASTLDDLTDKNGATTTAVDSAQTANGPEKSTELASARSTPAYRQVDRPSEQRIQDFSLTRLENKTSKHPSELLAIENVSQTSSQQESTLTDSTSANNGGSKSAPTKSLAKSSASPPEKATRRSPKASTSGGTLLNGSTLEALFRLNPTSKKSLGRTKTPSVSPSRAATSASQPAKVANLSNQIEAELNEKLRSMRGSQQPVRSPTLVLPTQDYDTRPSQRISDVVQELAIKVNKLSLQQAPNSSQKSAPIAHTEPLHELSESDLSLASPPVKIPTTKRDQIQGRLCPGSHTGYSPPDTSSSSTAVVADVDAAMPVSVSASVPPTVGAVEVKGDNAMPVSVQHTTEGVAADIDHVLPLSVPPKQSRRVSSPKQVTVPSRPQQLQKSVPERKDTSATAMSATDSQKPREVSPPNQAVVDTRKEPNVTGSREPELTKVYVNEVILESSKHALENTIDEYCSYSCENCATKTTMAQGSGGVDVEDAMGSTAKNLPSDWIESAGRKSTTEEEAKTNESAELDLQPPQLLEESNNKNEKDEKELDLSKTMELGTGSRVEFVESDVDDKTDLEYRCSFDSLAAASQKAERRRAEHAIQTLFDQLLCDLAAEPNTLVDREDELPLITDDALTFPRRLISPESFKLEVVDPFIKRLRNSPDANIDVKDGRLLASFGARLLIVSTAKSFYRVGLRGVESVVGAFKAFFAAWLDESLLREREREKGQDVTIDLLSEDLHADLTMRAESVVEIHNHGEKGGEREDLSDSSSDPKVWNESLGFEAADELESTDSASLSTSTTSLTSCPELKTELKTTCNGNRRKRRRQPAGKSVANKRRSLVRPLEPEHEQEEDELEITEIVKSKRTNAHKPNLAAAKLSFEHFRIKFRCLYDIEFQRQDGMHFQFCMSSMWDQHKKHFGKHCNESCPCSWSLGVLTANVVQDYLSDRLRNAEDGWIAPQHLLNLNPGETPTGFSTNFANNFTSSIRDRWTLSPTETLKELCLLWPFHVGRHSFGRKCLHGCKCNEWKTFFLDRIEKRRQAETRQSCNTQNGADLPNEKMSISLAASNSSDESFSVYYDYDAQQPLGFTSKTIFRENEHSISWCFIASVHSSANSKDSLLRAGLRIVSVSLLDSANQVVSTASIKNHRDLKLQYYKAKTKGMGSKLRIFFSTSDISASHTAASETSDEGGTWDGGAAKQCSHQSHIPLNCQQQRRQAPSQSSSERDKMKERDTKESSSEQLKVSCTIANEPCRSAFKDSSDDIMKKNVSFSENVVFKTAAQAPLQMMGCKRNYEGTAAPTQDVPHPSKRQKSEGPSSQQGDRIPHIPKPQQYLPLEPLIAYLRAVSYQNLSNNWQKQFKVEERFQTTFFSGASVIDKKPILRSTRLRVTKDKLVVWGRKALKITGHPVVPQDKPKDGFSEESFLRLTEAGLTVLTVSKVTCTAADEATQPLTVPRVKCAPSVSSINHDDVGRPDKFFKTSLPSLPGKSWYLASGKSNVPCKFFKATRSDSGCPQGCNCLYLHIQKPVGPFVDNSLLQFKMLENVLCQTSLDNYGRPWYTACYHDCQQNIYYFSEGGQGFLSKEGVFWYTKEAEAKTAVSRVYAAASLHPNQIVALEKHADNPLKLPKRNPENVPPPPPVRPRGVPPYNNAPPPPPPRSRTAHAAGINKPRPLEPRGPAGYRDPSHLL